MGLLDRTNQISRGGIGACHAIRSFADFANPLLRSLREMHFTIHVRINFVNHRLKQTNMLRIIIVSLFLIAMITTANAQQKAEVKALRHVVLFKFKDTSKPDDIKRVEEAFAGLADKIKLIKDFEWGTNNSPENLNQGLTHCFFVTFSSDKDRDDYLVHPDHKAFVDVLRPHLDKVTVIDYWTK
jgi:hypothetical protein